MKKYLISYEIGSDDESLSIVFDDAETAFEYLEFLSLSKYSYHVIRVAVVD